MSTYIEAGDGWPAVPGARAGCLVVREVTNPATHASLEARKAELGERLRALHAGRDRAALAALPPVAPYVEYYRRFGKTYHVLAQIESVVLKAKALPRGAALVEAMFMAELEGQLLTAGHDLDLLRPPVAVCRAAGTETYTLLRGEEKKAAAGDMMMRDREGVISTVIHGPDRRTAIGPSTRNVLFAVYAPPGVGEERLRAHLYRILDYVRVFRPEARAEEPIIL